MAGSLTCARVTAPLFNDYKASFVISGANYPRSKAGRHTILAVKSTSSNPGSCSSLFAFKCSCAFSDQTHIVNSKASNFNSRAPKYLQRDVQPQTIHTFKHMKDRKSHILCQASQSPTTLEKEKAVPDDKMEELKDFLRQDLPHLFDEQGIDKSMYDSKVEFRDPITRYDSLEGYLFNIQILRRVFSPIFELHTVNQTGPHEITTRWTMTMTFALLLWKPKLIFTGLSIMRINPETGKFFSHIDIWDSIKNNEYFSFEAAKDVVRQMQYFKMPDLETPKYKVLKRTSVYEVREYQPFIVVETEGDVLPGSKGFNTIAGYIFGKNDKGEKMKMTTPVYTETVDEQSTSGVKIQIVLPLQSKLSELPSPLSDELKVRQVEGRIAAAIKFNGKPTDEIVREKEEQLVEALVKDELKPKAGFALARYNDPGSTYPLFMRNEVLTWLEDFKLD